MPELPEVEGYRRLAEVQALDRTIVDVDASDAWYVKGALSPEEVVAGLIGRRLIRARRTGKLLLIDLAPAAGAGSPDGTAPEGRHGTAPEGRHGTAPEGRHGTVLGLRFGMSGRLVVDGLVSVDRLLYSSNRLDASYDRFVLRFADGGDLRVRDPRRLGGVQLDPDESRLGPDAATIGWPSFAGPSLAPPLR